MSNTFLSLPSRWLALGLVCLAMAGGFAGRSLTMDNRLDRMLSQHGPEADLYRRFLAEYGSDEFVIAAMTGKSVLEPAALDAMLRSYEELIKAPLVTQVTGIPKLYLERFGAEDPDALVEELTSTPFYQGLFLSKDHQSAGLLIQTEVLDQPGQREELVRGIDAALQPLRDYGFTTHLVGVPVLGATINQLSMTESRRYFPIAAIASLVCLLVLLRSARAALVVVACSGLAIAITLGFSAVLGQPLNLVTSAIPLVLWVLSLANTIHLVARYQHFRALGGTPREAARMALNNVMFACTLAAITTAIGFLSLMTADVSPVREFGLRIGFGIMAAHAVSMVVGPWMLILLRAPKPRWQASTDSKAFGRLADFVLRRKRPIIAVFSLVLVAGGLLATQIKSEPNSLKVLPQNHPTVQAYEYVGKNLTGMYTMELMVATPGGWLNPEYWPALEELKAFLLESDLVARVVTPLDFLRKVNQWEHDLDPAFYTLPTTREEALALWDPLGDTEKEEIKRLVRADGEEIRISALIASTEAARFGELVDATRAHIAALPAPLSAEITGAVTRMQAMQRELVRTQVSSFALSFLFIFLCIYVGLRNWRMTLLSMPPNMFSILTVFAVMVVRGISLDAGTVMVASIALGITVDNTLHVITAYLRECREGAPTDVALRVTMVEAGIPMTLAIITAGIGFFALTASSFVPIVNFGLLCGVALCFALAADLLFTPALLAWAAPRQKL